MEGMENLYLLTVQETRSQHHHQNFPKQVKTHSAFGMFINELHDRIVSLLTRTPHTYTFTSKLRLMFHA